jgi:2-polyprenyl-3-methyl-5-hydroxy-6-metoxy-1,4-benzoquinol methylase
MPTEELTEKQIENSRNKSLFKMGYRGKAKPVNFKKFSKSAKLHVEKISEIKAESVLDIGCGSGEIRVGNKKFIWSGIDTRGNRPCNEKI